MSKTEIDAKIDQIRELCRDTLRSLRAEAEHHEYSAALEAAVARRRRCIEIFDAWYASLSRRAAHAFRKATDGFAWDGDSLARMTIWDLRLSPNVGDKTVSEIVESLRAFGVEVPENLNGSVVVTIIPAARSASETGSESVAGDVNSVGGCCTRNAEPNA